MIKQLIVGLDGSRYTEVAVRYGIDLARAQSARLMGLAVADIRDIEDAYHTSRPLGAGSADAELYKKKLEEARKRADSAIETFDKLCEEQNVDHHSLKVEGYPAQEILKAATWNDLVVLSKRTRFACGLPEGEYCDASQEVLDHSIRPLLLVPGEHRQINRVMVAMDFHRLSDRLFYSYVHLNPFPGAEMHMIHAAQHGDRGREFPEGFIEYFKVHEIKVKTKILYGDHPGQAIVNYAKAEDIDLVVMGIHNMSKVWKVLLGSTGRYVIEHLDLPIYTQT